MFSLSAATVSKKRMLSGEKERRLVKARKREESKSEVDVFVENEWRLLGELDKARKRDDLEEGNREIDVRSMFVAKLRGEFEEDFHDFQDY